jgi:uncharacterized protein YbgA (DUF1722 family)
MSYETEYRSLGQAAASIAAHDDAIASYTSTLARLREVSPQDASTAAAIADIERLLKDATAERQRARNWQIAMSDKATRGTAPINPTTGLQNPRA